MLGACFLEGEPVSESWNAIQRESKDETHGEMDRECICNYPRQHPAIQPQWQKGLRTSGLQLEYILLYILHIYLKPYSSMHTNT